MSVYCSIFYLEIRQFCRNKLLQLVFRKISWQFEKSNKSNTLSFPRLKSFTMCYREVKWLQHDLWNKELRSYNFICSISCETVRHVCFVDFGMVSGLLYAEMKSINLPLCADRRMGEIPAEIESSSDSSQLTKIRLSRTRASVPAVRVCVMWMCESTTKFRSLLAFLWPVIYSASNIFLHAPAY